MGGFANCLWTSFWPVSQMSRRIFNNTRPIQFVKFSLSGLKHNHCNRHWWQQHCCWRKQSLGQQLSCLGRAAPKSSTSFSRWNPETNQHPFAYFKQFTLLTREGKEIKSSFYFFPSYGLCKKVKRPMKTWPRLNPTWQRPALEMNCMQFRMQYGWELSSSQELCPLHCLGHEVQLPAWLLHKINGTGRTH